MVNNHERILVSVDAALADILPGYLVNRRRDVQSLTDLLAQAAFADMRVLGHRMKGSGAGYGLDTISELGKKIEQTAHAKSQTELAVVIAALDDFLQRLTVVYTDG